MNGKNVNGSISDAVSIDPSFVVQKPFGSRIYIKPYMLNKNIPLKKKYFDFVRVKMFFYPAMINKR